MRRDVAIPRARHRGLAAVEFAITLPVLLLVMLATSEFGRMLSQANTLAKSVRDAARYAATKAAVGTTRVVNISPAVSSEAKNLAVTGSAVGAGRALLPGFTVDNVTVADAGNGYVSVAATYTYQPMLGVRLPTLGLGPAPTLSVPLTAVVIMRAL